MPATGPPKLSMVGMIVWCPYHRIQSGEGECLILSVRAAGVGLNLTRADHVIHFDRHWNTAVEDQATDRAHRIGRRETVHVHHLIAENTVEDHIGELLRHKRDR